VLSSVVLILQFFLHSWRCWEKCLDNPADSESVSVSSEDCHADENDIQIL
jgi:hypothetical protein